MIDRKLLAGTTPRKPLRNIDDFETNTREYSNVAIQKQVQISPNKFSNDGRKLKYAIRFPPGPMGLELEPVIISTDTKIGSRVKDYYFGLNFSGISPEELKARVKPGDIITHIDSQSVLSLPFHEILDKLRLLTSKTRIIAFKNVTASWNNTLESNYNMQQPCSPTKHISSPMESQKSRQNEKLLEEPLGQPEAVHTPVMLSNLERRILSDRSRTPPSTTKYPLSTNCSDNSPVIQQQGAGPSFISPISALTNTSSPTALCRTSGSDSAAPVATTPTNAPTATHAVDHVAAPARPRRSKSVDSVSSRTSNPHHGNQQCSVDKDPHTLLVEVGAHIGEGVMVAGSVVGSAVGQLASDTIIAVGSAVTNRAVRVLDDTVVNVLPCYSAKEMSDITRSRDLLLEELSVTRHQLGETQERLQAAEDCIRALELSEEQWRGSHNVLSEQTETFRKCVIEAQESEQKSVELWEMRYEELSLRHRIAQEEVGAFRSQVGSLQQDIQSYKASNDSLRENVSDAMEAVKSARQSESDVRSQLTQVQKEMAAKEDEFRISQATLEKENAVRLQTQITALQSVFEQLRTAEQQRESAVAEVEVIKDLTSSEKAALLEDMSLVRSQWTLQAEMYEEKLSEIEDEISSLRARCTGLESDLEKSLVLLQRSDGEVKDLKQQLRTVMEEKSSIIRSLTDFSEKCVDLQHKNSTLAIELSSESDRCHRLQLDLSVATSTIADCNARTESVSTSHRLEREQLERNLSEKDVQLTQAQRLYLETSEKLSGLRDEIENLRAVLSIAREAAEEWQGKAEASEALRVSAASESQQQASLVTDCTRRLHLQARELEQLTERLQQSEGERATLQGEVSGLRSRCVTAENELEASRIRLKEADICNSEQKALVQRVEEEKAVLSGKVNSMNEEILVLGRTLSLVQQQFRDEAKRATELQNELSLASMTVTNLTSNAESAKTSHKLEREQLERNLSEKDVQLTQAQRLYLETSEKLSTVRQECEKFRTASVLAREAAEEWQGKAEASEALRVSAASESQQQASLVTDCTRRLHLQARELEQLTERLQQSEGERVALQGEVSGLRSRCVTAENELEASRMRLKEADVKAIDQGLHLLSVASENSALSHDEKQKTEKCLKLEKELVDESNRSKALEQRLLVASTKIAELSAKTELYVSQEFERERLASMGSAMEAELCQWRSQHSEISEQLVLAQADKERSQAELLQIISKCATLQAALDSNREQLQHVELAKSDLLRQHTVLRDEVQRWEQHSSAADAKLITLREKYSAVKTISAEKIRSLEVRCKSLQDECELQRAELAKLQTERSPSDQAVLQEMQAALVAVNKREAKMREALVAANRREKELHASLAAVTQKETDAREALDAVDKREKEVRAQLVDLHSLVEVMGCSDSSTALKKGDASTVSAVRAMLASTKSLKLETTAIRQSFMISEADHRTGMRVLKDAMKVFAEKVTTAQAAAAASIASEMKRRVEAEQLSKELLLSRSEASTLETRIRLTEKENCECLKREANLLDEVRRIEQENMLLRGESSGLLMQLRNAEEAQRLLEGRHSDAINSVLNKVIAAQEARDDEALLLAMRGKDDEIHKLQETIEELRNTVLSHRHALTRSEECHQTNCRMQADTVWKLEAAENRAAESEARVHELEVALYSLSLGSNQQPYRHQGRENEHSNRLVWTGNQLAHGANAVIPMRYSHTMRDWLQQVDRRCTAATSILSLLLNSDEFLSWSCDGGDQRKFLSDRVEEVGLQLLDLQALVASPPANVVSEHTGPRASRHERYLSSSCVTIQSARAVIRLQRKLIRSKSVEIQSLTEKTVVLRRAEVKLREVIANSEETNSRAGDERELGRLLRCARRLHNVKVLARCFARLCVEARVKFKRCEQSSVAPQTVESKPSCAIVNKEKPTYSKSGINAGSVVIVRRTAVKSKSNCAVQGDDDVTSKRAALVNTNVNARAKKEISTKGTTRSFKI